MARISDAINQGLENLSTSPLGMASLGLLMQPSMSREPINPLEYAIAGMETGIKNKFSREKARSEEEARRIRLLMDVQRYQQEEMKMRMAQQKQERQAQAMQELMSTLSPEEARMAAVLGPEYVKQMMQQQRMQPPTSLQQNLMAAGLQPGTPEFQQAMMTAINRPQVQIGGQIKAPTGYMLNPEGTGVVPIPGMPPKPAPMTPEQQVQQSAATAEATARAKAKVKEEQSQQGVQPAIQDMYAAVEAWRSNKKDVNALASVSQQRRRLAQMLAQRRNPGRAPTDADVKIALEDIPDPLSTQQLAGSVMGGDPWAARMKVVEQELGGTPARGASSGRSGVLPSGHKYEIVED